MHTELYAALALRAEGLFAKAGLQGLMDLYHLQVETGNDPDGEAASPNGELDETKKCWTLLTGRQVDIARLVIKGRSNGEIARELSIGEGTVKQHLRSISTKLGAHSRTAVATLLAGGEWREDVVAGAGLSDRMLDLLRGIIEGKANKIIAQELGITEGTVKLHSTRLFGRIGVGNRTEAASWYRKRLQAHARCQGAAVTLAAE